jgi:antitoxin component YwqK of YwqJK toxin-antitoxin module
MLNGKPIGYWKAFYPNGILKSEGNRENYELSGVWKFYRQNGDLIKEINYRNGKKNGLTNIYSDSCKLLKTEIYKDDILHGKVQTFYPDEGELKSVIPYKNGLKEGVAYEFAKADQRILTMTTYDHDFIKKQEKINRKNNLGKQGVWREFYPADSSLKREIRYKNDIYHGYYKEYDRDGKLIVALLYIDGILQENPEELTSLEIRKTYFENGAVESEISYNYLGEKDGASKFFSKKGEIEEVNIYSKGSLLAKGKLNKKGERIDYWEFYYESEKLRAKGEYKDGLKIGVWNYYHENGKIEQQGKYVKGENPHGDWTWYYPNGEVWREESFWKGKEEGMATEYSDTNTVISKGEYIDGKKDGVWFYELGDHREEGRYIEGLKDGEWIYYYPNKKINFKGSYINGDPDGKHFYYYLNGKIKREEYYELGLQEGTWRTYDEEGNLILTSEWEGGKEVRLDKKKVK